VNIFHSMIVQLRPLAVPCLSLQASLDGTLILVKVLIFYLN